MTAPFTPDSAAPEPSTPSNISITALARFEFEAGKANDGTKILMIEWEDIRAGSWHVFWEGKKAVLPADEQTSESTRRFYFLLPPDVTIPPVVMLEYHPAASGQTTEETGADAGADQKPSTIQLNPLPAIFPPELGVTGRSAGKKGVLHTIWAKKRLQVLEKEIREECLSNVEGIALHMAVQEKEWIETHFGLGPNVDTSDANNGGHGHGRNYPMGPTTPVSPGGSGKLGEKLKGLKLQTSEQGLSPREGMLFYFDGMLDAVLTVIGSAARLLSPQSPDVAISSFNSFHTIHNPNPPAVKAVAPPESIQAQQHANNGSSGFASMNSLAGPSNIDSGEELFAKALSPRSPDLPRSPFSFAPETLHM